MYGIPIDLDLQCIVGCDVNQLKLGRYDVQFEFNGAAIIAVQSPITLLENGEVISCWNEETNWSSLGFQKLLNAVVIEYKVVNERLLEIEFKGKLVVQLHDPTDKYEAMQIYFYDKSKNEIYI